jgi:hypothetical protein
MSAPQVNPLVPVQPQRLRHGRGERLQRADFDDQAAQDDQLRWWHSRALHQAYGVVTGLEVTFALVNGVMVAEVAAGLAYDCHGRELLLDRPRRIPVPDDDTVFVLVIGSAAPEPGCAPPPGGWCRDERVKAGGVVLRWVPRADLSLRDGVPLETSDEAAGPMSRPLVRPLARPRIGHGTTVPGETAWRPWVQAFPNQPVLRLGLQVEVDTSAAGFTAVPCYFAQVTGSMWSAKVPLALLLPFGHIAQAAKDRFTFRIVAPWLYIIARIGTRRTPEPEPEPPVLLEETPAVAEARRPLDEPDFLQAFLGLGRATRLAVAWTGIQQLGDGDDPVAHADTDGGSHGLH